MIRHYASLAMIAASLVLPVAANAQGVPGGMDRGAREG